jgi:hypothetical protein
MRSLSICQVIQGHRGAPYLELRLHCHRWIGIFIEVLRANSFFLGPTSIFQNTGRLLIRRPELNGGTNAD